MTLILIGKGLVLGGWTSKIEVVGLLGTFSVLLWWMYRWRCQSHGSYGIEFAVKKQPTRIQPFISVELRWLTCYFHWINLGSLSGIQELLVDLLRLTPIFTVCRLYLLRINISALPTENQPKINPFGPSHPRVGSQTFTDWHHLTTSSGIKWLKLFEWNIMVFVTS